MIFGLGIVLYIIHILGDFYLVNQNYIGDKREKYLPIILHSVLYQCLFIILLILFGYETKLFEVLLIIGISHFIIETLIFLINIEKKTNMIWLKRYLVLIKQFIHIIIILLGLFYLRYEGYTSTQAVSFFNDNLYYLKLFLAFILIGKPSNVIFKKIFVQFKPVDVTNNQDNKEYKNSGAMIGTLERILILICIINGIYSSIGLILTAKSIARYNRISSDPTFSEYYLMGTLSSVLFTIIFYTLCFKLV